MKSNTGDIVLVILLIIVGGIGSFIGNHYGRRSGFNEGAFETRVEMEKIMHEEIALIKEQLSGRYDRGYDHGKAVATSDCEQRVRTNDTVCKMDIEKMYKQGVRDTIRHVSVKCGKSK